MKLEIGSGYNPTPGFVHLDVNPLAPDVDICSEAYPLVGVENESCDEVRAVDVLEHLPYRLSGAVLIEWARVLKPGGRIYVQVPDAGEIMCRYADVRRAGESDPENYEMAWRRLTRGLPVDLEQSALMGACWRLLGGQDDGVYARADDNADWNLHRALFDLNRLVDLTQRAGLDVLDVVTNPHPNLCMNAQKPPR